ncbi:MAG: 16S rRNA (cytosine(1402)-N(4))-methyltransferase RsmH [Candidatus Komeilibacteria bacterium]
MSAYSHESVMVAEVLQYLQVGPNKNYIDGTVGGGGHAEAILKKNGPHGRVLGLDLDPRAIAAATSRLRRFGARAIVRRENYKQITKKFDAVSSITPISGFLLDLGVSSDQLDTAGRGFSFTDQGPLDMRFDPETGQTAAQLIARVPEDELGQIIRDYGDERQWRKIARSLKQVSRQFDNRLLVPQIVEAITKVLPPRITKIHPATKTFQALRIAINQELDNIQQALPRIIELLPSGARLVIIAFHSAEDRIVKHWFRSQARDCICPASQPICTCSHKASLKILTKKAIRPGPEEISNNHRSRSAVLRAVEKI